MAETSPELIQSIREQVYNAAPAQSAPIVENQPANNVPASTPETVVEPAVEPAASPVFDPNVFAKEHFGVDSLDLAKQQWGELQQMKAAPPIVYKDIEFPDEMGKKLYENIKAGKEEEVANYIRGRQLLKDVTTKAPEDQIKLYIQLTNPRFDRADVEDEFKDTYFLDEENIAPEKLARERKKMDQRKEDDFRKAQEYFTQYQSKIELPDIQHAKPVVDPGYQEFQELVQKEQNDAKVLQESFAKLTDNDLSYSMKFNDEASKLSFDLSFTPDTQAIGKSKEAAANFFEFLNTNYRNSDGSPKTAEWIRDLSILQDLPKYTAAVAVQAINAERKRMLATQKNVVDPAQRQYNIPPQTELDKLREQVFGKVG